MSTLLSIREYARRKGCSDTAVHKAIKAEKIVKGVDYTNPKRPKINPDIADKEWSAFKDPDYRRRARNGKEIFEEEVKPSEPVETATNPRTDTSLAAAKRAQAVYKAKILELEMKQKQGSLVDRDQVYKALFAAGQEVRSALQAVPDRFIDNILAARSRNEAHSILSNAIADALEKLADGSKELITKR